MKLALFYVNGVNRVHAATCRDVQREARPWNEPEFIEAATRHDVNVHAWGDVAADNYPEGSPEWHAECDENGGDWGGTVFLPCCASLPATLPELPA